MAAGNVNNMSEEELMQMQQQLSEEIFVLKNSLSYVRKLEKPHLLLQKKKERARVLTALNKKKRKES